MFISCPSRTKLEFALKPIWLIFVFKSGQQYVNCLVWEFTIFVSFLNVSTLFWNKISKYFWQSCPSSLIPLQVIRSMQLLGRLTHNLKIFWNSVGSCTIKKTNKQTKPRNIFILVFELGSTPLLYWQCLWTLFKKHTTAYCYAKIIRKIFTPGWLSKLLGCLLITSLQNTYSFVTFPHRQTLMPLLFL